MPKAPPPAPWPGSSGRGPWVVRAAAAEMLLAAVAEQAARLPNRLAHVSPDGSLTYGQLLARAATASALLAGGEAPPAPVLVWGHKQPAMPVAFLACALAGRPYVPADAAFPPARVARIARAAGATSCLAAAALPAELETALRAEGLDPVPLGPDGVAPAAAAPRAGPAPVAAGSETAYILFTSGSSGDPKGVPIPWTALRHFTTWLLAEQGPRAGAEVVLNQAPFSFDLSVLDLYLSLLCGGTLFSVSADMVAAPRRLFAALGGSDLTVWVSTPSFARFCLSEPTFDAGLLPGLRRLLFCGETLPPGLARELLRRFPRAEVWNTYGPTEATVAVTSIRVSADMAARDEPLPVGRAADGLRVWVAGPDLAARPEGTPGEIIIAGPQVAPGYLCPPAGSGVAAPPPDRFVEFAGERCYRTGDAGVLRAGLLYYTGRLDRQVKIRGYRLELDEIETHLRRLPGVSEAAVLVVERGGFADHLAAFVVCPGDPASDGAAGLPADPAAAFARGQALRAALGRTLPAYAVPRSVHLLPSLPLTPNGKLDRRALEARLA